jgi:hypothetical protein
LWYILLSGSADPQINSTFKEQSIIRSVVDLGFPQIFIKESNLIIKVVKPTLKKGVNMSIRNLNGGDNFLAMSVHNIGFLLDRLGQDCHPLQYLRELTQNSIEAIQRTKKKGEIIWDVDWTTYDLENGAYKLSVTDNGDGMTGEEMVRFINQLSSSMSTQSMSGNYGVGAKITTATKNPFGVLYLSWKNGEGSMIQMYKDEDTGQYGLKQWKHSNGSYKHYLPIENDVKPDLIQAHGTKVVLLGMADEANTMQAPSGAPSPSRWISKYLNTRYFELPEGITLKAREGWEYPRTDKDRNYLRGLSGQAAYLSQHSSASGKVALTAAIAHWWILKDETAITNNSGYVESSGHAAALYQNELYELNTARSGMAKLQQFGVTFGYRFVVIYVEPSNTSQLTTNTARTTLLINNDALPWADWASEFREKMPEEIAKLVAEKAAAAANTDHQKSIKDRLKDIMDLFKVSRYRLTQNGSAFIDEDRLIRGGNIGSQNRGNGKNGTGKTQTGGGTGGNVYAVFEKVDGVQGKKIKPDPFPEVRWVTVANGTREPKDMEDRAAKYLQEQNLLLINGDFSVFTDMIGFFRKEYRDRTAITEVTEEVVRSWFEQALVETILGIQGLMNRKEWTQANIDSALSQEALTASVMQRYHVHLAAKRELGVKIGSSKTHAN